MWCNYVKYYHTYAHAKLDLIIKDETECFKWSQGLIHTLKRAKSNAQSE